MANRPYTVESLLRRAGDLPAMPHVTQRALALIRNRDSNMTELADVLALDQAMASLVLRWANSAYYSLRSPVATVRQAVVYLGHSAIQSLLLAASIASYLERPVPGYALERGELWKHSVGVAAGARLITLKFGTQVAEEAYSAGLLADIGKLALDIALREADLSGLDSGTQSFTDLETGFFGIDHATLGAEMARRWHLPEHLVEAIAYHHRPSLANAGGLLAAAVHVADGAMMMLGVGLGRDGLQYALDPLAYERMGWTEAQLPELVDRVLPLISEAEAFVQPGRK